MTDTARKAIARLQDLRFKEDGFEDLRLGVVAALDALGDGTRGARALPWRLEIATRLYIASMSGVTSTTLTPDQAIQEADRLIEANARV